MALSTSRSERGQQPGGGRGGRNGLVARGCRGQQGPGDQVKGGNIASAGRARGGGGWREWTLL